MFIFKSCFIFISCSAIYWLFCIALCKNQTLHGHRTAAEICIASPLRLVVRPVVTCQVFSKTCPSSLFEPHRETGQAPGGGVAGGEVAGFRPIELDVRIFLKGWRTEPHSESKSALFQRSKGHAGETKISWQIQRLGIK